MRKFLLPIIFAGPLCLIAAGVWAQDPSPARNSAHGTSAVISDVQGRSTVSSGVQGQSAERSSVQGHVTDELGSVPGATIVVRGSYSGTISTTDGSFVMSDLAPGHVVFDITFIGYDPKSVEIDL